MWTGCLCKCAAALHTAVSTPWAAGGFGRSWGGLTHHKGPYSLVPTHLGSRLLSLQELVRGKAGLPWEAGICISAPTGEGCSASLSFGCWCQDP